MASSTGYTLTAGSPTQTFALAADDNIEILVSIDNNTTSVGTAPLKFYLEAEYTTGVYIPIYEVVTSKYDLKIGNYRLRLQNAGPNTSVKFVLKLS